MAFRQSVCAGVCAVVAAGCLGGSEHASTSHRKLPTSVLIVPGASIAGISIGDTRSRVQAVLGPGVVTARTASPGVTGPIVRFRVEYADAGLAVAYSSLASGRTPVVVRVSTRSSRYHTRTGIKVGTSARTVAHLPGIVCDSASSFAGMICSIQGGQGQDAELSLVTPVLSFGILNGRVQDVALIGMFHADGRLAKPNARLADW